MQPNGRKPGQQVLRTAASGRRFYPVPAWHWQLPLLVTIVLIVAIPRAMAAPPPDDLDATVQYLITYVQEADVIFERNSTRYDGHEAAGHINRKYQHFKDEIDTPETFIALCATGSLLTGKPYIVTTKQGVQLPAGEWLNSALAVYRHRHESVVP